MPFTLLVPMLLILVAGGAVLAYLGFRASQEHISIEDRLAQFAESPMTLEEIELSLPFKDRVLAPMFLAAARSVSRFLPSRNVEKLRKNLVQAGSPSRLGPAEFIGIRLLVALLLGGSFLFLFAISGLSGLQLAMFPIVVAVIGYLIPGMWLNRKVKERKKEIQLALPDAIDLLTISVEAGLGFDPALRRVTEKWDNALMDEFKQMLGEMQMGVARRQAMRSLAERVDVDDLNVFVSSMVQADQLGVSISQVLRVQSRQMRIRRRQRAEEQAHKAPIKMLFPMVFLIFPALYVVILGPAIPQILESGAF